MSNDRRQSKMTRLAAMFFAVWFVVLSVGTPRRAEAILPVAETNPVWLKEQADRLAASIMKDSFMFQIQLALVNMISRFAEQVAYETAVWVASGGKGESALFNPQDGDNFWADTALGAGLQFVDDMDKNIIGPAWNLEDGFGLANFICAPDLRIQAVIKLAVMDRLRPKPPLCSYKDFKKRWSWSGDQGLASSLSGSGIGFEQGESDLSAALEVHNSISDKLIGKQQREFWQYVQNNGFKPMSDKISGLTRTPAEYVQKDVSDSLRGVKKDTPIKTQEEMTKSLGSFDYLLPMLGQAGQALAINFAATLAAQTLQRQVFGKGIFYNFPIPTSGDPYSAPSSNNREQAQAVYASFIAPKVTTASEYDPIAEFATCDPQRRQPTTCVIDTNFQEAIRRALSGQPITVKEAMDAKLLHEEWRFIPAGTIDDIDPNCYQRAYCASNLAKLRLARVLPVGWEFAANHEKNEEPHVTLGQAIRDFNKTGADGICNNANVGSGEAQESPYCGLVDPNWVLKFPITQCRTRGPGETLLDRSGNIRADVCTDYQSCTETDANGRCIGEYGFCIREKNTWYVRGTTCPPQAAACRALRSRTGSDLSIITTTVDSTQCNAENAGCLWYASKRNASGNWVSATDRRYFNRNVEQCEPVDEGCAELLNQSTAQPNLIVNPSFEEKESNGSPRGWVTDSTQTVYSTDGTQSADGQSAVQPKYPYAGGGSDAGKGFVQTPILVTPGQKYTISASAKQSASTVSSGLRLDLSFFTNTTATGAAIQVSNENRGTCNWTRGTILAFGFTPASATSPAVPSYERESCTFTTPGDAVSMSLLVMGDDTDPVWADTIQIEEGGTETSFHDGYAPNAPKTYLRTATDDLNCDNPNASLRNPSCGTFTKTCDQSDIGCERYTATDAALSVTGKYTENDRCPAQCVGYSAFKEIESNYDQKDAFDYFIPTTARQCSSVDVGCSEFTNLDQLTAGGEAREYYTFLRQCRKESDTDASPATYYTWEGSAEQGYQLRSFRLKSSTSDANSAPHVTVPASGGGADCGPNGTDEYGKAGQSDCRAFYSQNGTINYRRLSQTVIITDDCVPYRLSQNLDEPTCITKGGVFTSGACTFKGYRAESRQCNAAAVGCREYRGNSGGAVRTLVNTDFETTNVPLLQGWAGGDQSTETLIVGGHSMKLVAGQESQYPLRETVSGITQEECAKRNGDFTAASGANPSQCVASRLRTGGTYELILIGKGVGTFTSSIQDTTTSPQITLAFADNQAVFGSSWQRVVLGPAILNQFPTKDAYLKLAAGDRDVFIDSVILREIPTTIAVVKGSWVTPSSCDRATIDPNSAPQAQGMLGCREYKDRAGAVATLRSFSKLCGSDVVGCTAFYDTRGNSEREAKTYNNPSPDPSDLDDAAVPVDTLRYLVDAPEKRCQATAAGCRRVALPTLDRTNDVKGAVVADGWKETFLKDIPAKYEGPGATLCTDEALFCEEFSGRDGSLLEFKDPGNRTCVFRGDPVQMPDGSQRVGWFRSASLVPPASGAAPTPVGCDPTYIIRGAEFGIRKNSDEPQYEERTGLCEPAQDLCTEFRDTTDQTPSYPDGKPYQVIKDASLDLASCAGTVSRKEGCALLNDTTRPEKMWSAAATYAESDLLRGAKVPPINCDQTSEKCKRCVLTRNCRAIDGTAQPYATATPPRAGNDCTAYPNDSCGSPPTSCTVDAQCDTSGGYTCRGGEYGKQCTALGLGQGGCTSLESCVSVSNDSNLIAKVQRDRACSEWLQSDTCMTSFSKIQNREVKSCYGLTQMTDQRGVRDSASVKPALTREAYQSRERTWGAQEASGYAIPNVAPLSVLKQVAATWTESNDCTEDTLDGCNTSCNPRVAPTTCTIDDRRLSYTVADKCGSGRAQIANWDECGDALPEFGGRRGLCFNGLCAYGIKKSTATTKEDRVKAWPRPTCKVFPESDSPFSHDTVFEPGSIERKPFYAQANACLDNQDCACSYKKGIFEAGSLYYSRDTDPPSTVCVGGENEGKSCSRDADCNDKGTCSKLKETRTVQGIEGYCLEQDDSMVQGNPFAPDATTRCRTFLPVDQLAGSVDVNSVVDTAGLNLPVGQDWYCSNPASRDAKVEISRRITNNGNEDTGVIDLAPNAGSGPWNWSAGGAKPFGNPPDLQNGGFSNTFPPSFVSLFGSLPGGVIQNPNMEWMGANDIACEKRGEDNKGWCLFPGTRADAAVRCKGDGGSTRLSGCMYRGNVVDATKGGFAFFGCYEVRGKKGGNSYLEKIFFPWTEDQFSIYDWQVASVRVELASAFAGGNQAVAGGPCGGISQQAGEGLDDDPFGDTSILLTRKIGADGSVVFSEKRTPEDVGVAFHALFNKDTHKFDGVAVEAYKKDEDSLMFYVKGIRFILKDGCEQIAQVSSGSRNYAWTDRTWLTRPGIETDPAKDPIAGEYERVANNRVVTKCTPWGGMRVGSNSGAPLYDMASDTNAYGIATTGTNCDDTAITGALYMVPQLDDLFAKAYTLLGFGSASISGDFFKKLSYDTSATGFDARPSDPNPPKVSAVVNRDCDSSGRKCAEDRDKDGKFSVNDKVDGNVVGEGGTLKATLKFFAWADKNHMPIRRIKVDFGDGIGEYDAADNGSYPNRRGFQDSSLANSYCDNSNFGQSTEACSARPISLEHTYQCVRNACRTTQGADCWVQSENNNTGACVFRPRVFIEDNWGYCTGSCPGGLAGSACFESDECDPDQNSTTNNPWVSFGGGAGKVIVLPP